MTFSHEDANARLLDLVYGEAAPAEREALQAHVATCARCQEELAALGDTRARLRVALNDQPPPAAAHARILAAAAAEAANGAQSGAATAPPAKGNEPASRAGRTEDQPSFWDWLRGKWTFPTLATVGAVAVMLLGAKVFMNPQKTLERGREGIVPKEEAPSPAPAPPAPVAPSALEPDNLPLRAEAKANAPFEEQERLSPQARARIQAVRQYNKPRTSVDSVMGSQPSFKNDKLGGAPASQAIGRLRPDDFGGGGSGSARGASGGHVAAAPPPPVEKKPSKGSMDDLLEGSLSHSGPRYAPPPAGWKSSQPAASAPAAPAPPPAPKPALAKKRAVSEDDALDGLGGGSYGARTRAAPERDEEVSGNAQAEAPPSRRKSAPAPVPAGEARPETVAPAPVARSEAAKAAEAPAETKKEKDAAPSYEALAKRADELYAAHRWPEAIAAYNDLLRRFPTAEPAPRWRSRVGIAQREAAPKAAPAAKAATKKAAPSDSALEGL